MWEEKKHIQTLNMSLLDILLIFFGSTAKKYQSNQYLPEVNLVPNIEGIL